MNTKSILYLFAFLGSFLLISSCVENEFDEPPIDGEDPNITANATIADIKAVHELGAFKTIEEDLIIEVLVVADDESGNFFKTLIIGDETGGLAVLVNAAGLYNDFPIGRKLFIKCQGLVISDFNGLIQMGGSFFTETDGDQRLAGIDEVLINQFIFPGVRNQEVRPTVYTINQLNEGKNSTLVQLDNVEFKASDKGVVYADGTNNIAKNLILEDCNGGSILVRTSGFSNFASELTPEGNGTFIGIMSSFGTDLQLIIRNTFELDGMTAEPCNGAGGGGGGGIVGFCQGAGDGVVEENFSSETAENDITLSGWCNISTQGERLWIGKEFDGNVYAQATAFGDRAPASESWLITETVDVTTPQFLNFETAIAFYTHDGLSVWISSDFEGDPTAATWTELDGFIPGSGDSENVFIPSGDIDLSGFTGNVNIAFRYNGAAGAGQTGTFRVDNVKISEEGGGIPGGGGGGGGDPLSVCGGEGDGEVDEDFSSQEAFEDIALAGWCNVIAQGERFWRAREFEGNTYAQASAFTDNSPSMEAWLVSETVDVTSPQILNFESAQANYTHDGLSVWISSDFQGDPTAATWTELSATLPGEADTWFEFIPSGDIDLSGFTGDVNIGFKYVGSGPGGQTGSFQIDNVLISTDGVGTGGGGGGGGTDPVGVCEGEGDGEIDENFSSQSSNDDITFPGWCNIATAGERLWIGKEFDGNVYAQATAFNDASPTTVSWLITETFDISSNTKLNFESAKAFYTHDGLSVWISSDYTGDPESANWTQLNGNIADNGDDDHDFVPSGDIDLGGFTGSVNVAFRYDGSSSSGDTGTFRVDNIVISN